MVGSVLNDDPEVGTGGEVIEVCVGVEERGVVADADRGDQTVECPSDGDASASCLAVESCGASEIVEGLEAEHVEGEESALDPPNLAVVVKALEDFREDDIGQGDGFVLGDQLR